MEPKLNGNRERDRRTLRELARLGWRAIEVWECELGENGVFERLPGMIWARGLWLPMMNLGV